MICPFRTGASCMEICALYVKEYECCAFKYKAVKDIKKEKEDLELRAKIREKFKEFPR